MSRLTNETPAQTSLVRQIQIIEKQILELQDEKKALERLMLKVRREDLTVRDVSRKNSVDRILTETAILERLKLSKKPISSKNLLKSAKEVNPNLKDSTFRSHLSRMSDRRLIAKSTTHGFWALPKESSESGD